MKKTVIILILITILSKIFGFCRDIVLSYAYGTSNISDAYLISTTIPLVIFSFIGTSIATGYIPMYSNIKRKHGKKAAGKFTNNLINVLLLITTIIVIIGLLFTNTLVKVFAAGFEGDTFDLAVKFTRINLLGIYFTGIISIFAGFLQLKGKYVIPELVGLPLNIIMILSIIISLNTNVIVMSVGGVIAVLSELLFILPFAWKEGYRYKPVLDIKNKYLINMARTALPIILGMSVNEINVLVDRTLASKIAVGGISALNFSNRLTGFVQSIFVMSLVTVMFPMISKMSAEKNLRKLKKLVSNTIGTINLVIIPISFGVMIFAEQIVKMLYGRGSFDAQAVFMTSNALFYYSLGIFGFGLREVLSRVFYSIRDTKTPMVNAGMAIVLNIGLSLTLSRFMGINGLALATSISANFCTVLLFISLYKKIGSFDIKNISISIIKILCASSIMGILAKLAYGLLSNNINANFALLFSICIGALVYFSIIYFMKIKDFDVVIDSVKEKLKREKS